MSPKLNPFTNYGGIVYGKRFVGRSDAIRLIHERILTDDPGCLAIVGLPRIGKSSLVYQALIHQRDLVQAHKVIPIWIGMGTFHTPEAFFRKLILATQEALVDLNASTERIAIRSAQALDPNCPWMEFNHQMQQFFKCVRQSGWRIVFVIDEFDAARTIFGNNIAAFQAMRELHNQPEWRVAFVATSRRAISEIEAYSAISNLSGIFPELHIGPFSEQEATEMLGSLLDIGLEFDGSDLEFIKRKIGLHPYLVAVFVYHLANLWLDSEQADFEYALELSSATYITYYNRLVNLMSEDSTLNCLLQIASGATAGIRKTAIDKLKTYNIIQVGAHGEYAIFSQHLATYLNQLESTTSANTLLKKGQLIGTQYRVLTDPKTTAHSQVVMAWDEHLERHVAIKCLYTDGIPSNFVDELREIIRREGKILAQLSHPNIGVVYNTILDPLGIIMEWVDGASLQERLEGHSFSTPEVIQLGIQLADALNYLHTHPNRIVHRDIKPSNIILQKSGEPKLIDFDIARARSRQTIAQPRDGTISRIGTVEFSAPEQLEDSHLVGPPADLFSLGVVLYELCTQQLPYRSGNRPRNYYSGQLPQPDQLEIPQPLYDVLCKLLSENPEERLTAAQLKEALQKCLITTA